MQSDEQLMRAYIAGDTDAFRELFDRYSPMLLRFMQRDLSRREDASDLVQQTFLQLHRARADFRTDGRLRPWLMTIALNLKRENFRWRGRRPEVSLNNEGQDLRSSQIPDPESLAVSRDVQVAVSSLPDAQREVIELHWFAGLSFPEIAEAVGASLSAVKVRAHRGYEKMRDRFGDTLSDKVSTLRPTAKGTAQ